MGVKKSREGVVVKVVAGRYTVRSGGETYTASARGRLRLVGEIYVGDRVLFLAEKPFAVIEKVAERKNSLIRPYVANIDTALIVVAKEPIPDLLLVDKIIVNCAREGITPVLCYNKADIALESEIEEVIGAYRGLVRCFVISAKSGEGIDELAEVVSGGLAVLAGQSAVGKTSLLNVILGLSLKTDGLSKKVMRGKNTTRHIEIFDALGGHIADTCGFSLLEFTDMQPEELKFYYDDFINLAPDCRHRRCDHIGEPDCAVRAASENGDIDKGRYQRYNVIYNELKEMHKKKYG